MTIRIGRIGVAIAIASALSGTGCRNPSPSADATEFRVVEEAGGRTVSTGEVDAAGDVAASLTPADGVDLGHPVAGGPHSSLSFEGTTDVYALVSISAAAASTDAEAAWLVSRGLDYCMPFSRAPQFYRDRVLPSAGNPTGKTTAAAYARVVTRCEGFASNGLEITPAEVSSAVANAALAGSIAAEAMLFASNRAAAEDPAYGPELARRVAASRDPEAYVAMAEAMGPMVSATSEAYGGVGGTHNTYLAWQLAACDVGLDCTRSGVLMTQYCVNGGICGPYPDFRSLLLEQVSKVDYETIVRVVDMIRKGEF